MDKQNGSLTNLAALGYGQRFILEFFPFLHPLASVDAMFSLLHLSKDCFIKRCFLTDLCSSMFRPLMWEAYIIVDSLLLLGTGQLSAIIAEECGTIAISFIKNGMF